MTSKILEQPNLWDINNAQARRTENPRYLTEQIITYIGNKRQLLPLIHDALASVRERLNKPKLRMLDAFAGSGVVSRYFKQYAEHLVSNDLERYAAVIGHCYLANASELDLDALHEAHRRLCRVAEADETDPPGIIRRFYSPRDDKNIREGERVFYTNRNAAQLDRFRRYIGELPEWQQPFFLAPLLHEASVHANTSGVFKGFYKNSDTGIGQFGGNGRNALTRITGDIELQFPVFSRFDADCEVRQEDANSLVRSLKGLDVAYFDPPYNQHPYGSNYFMLNLLVDYKEPENTSKVSGIPDNWNRSLYNKRKQVYGALRDLFEHTDAKFILLSYNDEGYVGKNEIETLMARHGRVAVFERAYNTFRGSRNLRNRTIHVTEHLFLVERR